MDDMQKVGLLKTGNICPYCGERTVLKLGSTWEDISNARAMQVTGEFIGCYCKNKKCSMFDKCFHIPKSVYDK